MENTSLNQEKQKVIVWVTSPLYAKIILGKAFDYATKNNLELIAVSMQNPIGADWQSRSNDIAIIEKAARNVNAQLIVNFSENTLRTAYDILTEYKPVAMFTGVPKDINRSSAFLINIHQMCENAEMYTVDTNGSVLNYK